MRRFSPWDCADLAARFVASLAITTATELTRLLSAKAILVATLAAAVAAGFFLPLPLVAALLAAEALILLILLALALRRESKGRCSRLTARCEQNPGNIHYRYDRQGLDTPECCATHLVHVLFFTCDLLEKNGIPYFICDGTLLGAVRHHGLIPWDTDCDISVAEEWRLRLRKLAWTFIRHGLWVYEQERSFTIQYGTNGINSLHTDIYLNRTVAGGRIAYDDHAGIDWCDIYPLKRRPFHDRFLWAPNRAEKVLADYYGPDCLKTASRKYVRDGIPFPVGEEGRSPARLAHPLW